MLTEKPPPASDLDADNPALRRALAMLCANLSNQLAAAAHDLESAAATPWQCIAVARRLDQLREAVDFLRKETNRLKPPVAGVDDPFA
jgi:hypothetical protein